MITGNKEDYLKIIYELGGHHKKVSNKDIAQALGISRPSVSGMIKKLLDEGYVEYSSYQGISLTQLGLDKAMLIRRRHLLWEVFLVEKLGYDWEDVHEEAEKLEHITSVKLEMALDKYLEHPKFCPHGSPIVSKGNLPDFTPLNEFPEGKKGIIRRFKDSKELLNYIEDIDLSIGDHVELKNIDVSKETLTIVRNEKEINLNLEFSKNIYVE